MHHKPALYGFLIYIWLRFIIYGHISFPFTMDLLDIVSMYESASFFAFHVQSPTSEDSPPALLLNFDPNDSQSSLCAWFFGHHSSPKTCAMFFSSSLDPSTSAVLAPRESLLVAFPGTDPPWVSACIHFFYNDSVFYCLLSSYTTCFPHLSKSQIAQFVHLCWGHTLLSFWWPCRFLHGLRTYHQC